MTRTTFCCLVAALSVSMGLVGSPVADAQAVDAQRRTPVVVAVERASPAVVNISTEKVMMVEPDPFFDQFFQDFFEERRRARRYTQRSLGSGVITRPDGYVVTNSHVAARGAKIKVTLA